MSNVILLEDHRHALCASCGHSRGWHATNNEGCTHELQDANGGWIRCSCTEYRA
jgi:hypothetical protein